MVVLNIGWASCIVYCLKNNSIQHIRRMFWNLLFLIFEGRGFKFLGKDWFDGSRNSLLLRTHQSYQKQWNESSVIWQTSGPKTVVKYCGYAFGFYCGSSCDLYCGTKYVLWLNIVDLFLCIVVYVWLYSGFWFCLGYEVADKISKCLYCDLYCGPDFV